MISIKLSMVIRFDLVFECKRSEKYVGFLQNAGKIFREEGKIKREAPSGLPADVNLPIGLWLCHLLYFQN